MPSPNRRAHEEVVEAELGRQLRQHLQQANNEARDAGRVYLEARDDVERAAVLERELSGKRTMTPQEAKCACALAARTERRMAAAEEHRRKDATGPPNW
jgi:hypothetical protein